MKNSNWLLIIIIGSAILDLSFNIKPDYMLIHLYIATYFICKTIEDKI